MFGMSMTEILIIGVVALLLLGPKELPEAARTLGRTLRKVQRAGDDLRDTIEREIMEDRPLPKLRPVAESQPQVTPGGDDTLPAHAPPADPPDEGPTAATNAAQGTGGPATSPSAERI